MRLLRIRLRNFRGVDACDVRLSPLGVTVVEGPNEVGKSSLAEALDVLLDQLDSSRSRAVVALKPVHRDAGPEVEIEAESGPYAFTYRKRFLRERETVLAVTRPRPESLTGREAHERVLAILAETLDTDLWRALRIQQGDALQQPDLSTQRSLSAALDRAAGGATDDAGAESLFEAVAAEYRRYFTETGRDGRDLTASAAELESSRREAESVAARLRSLEADIARCAALQRETAELGPRIASLARIAADHEAALQRVHTVRGETEKHAAVREAARAALREAGRVLDERRRATQEAAQRAAEVETLRKDEAALEPARGEAATDLESARTALAGARSAHDAAHRVLGIRRLDREFRENELWLAQLRERQARIEQADADARAAEEVLARTRIDDAQLQAIREAHVEVERASARLEAAAPSLTIEAIAPSEIALDGVQTHLAARERRQVSVADRARVTVPGVVDITIAAGEGATAWRDRHAAARRRLRELCFAAGVDDLAAAETTNESRREAARALQTRDRVVEADLRDLDRQGLARRVASLAAKVGAGAPPRGEGGEPQLAADFDAAKALLAAAEAEAATATVALDAAQSRHDRATARHQELALKLRTAAAHVEVAARAAGAAAESLARARTSIADDELSARHVQATAAAAAAERAADDAAQRLAALDPEQVEALATNARRVVEKARADLRARESERDLLQGGLHSLGEQGLAERLAEAETRRARAEEAHRSLVARAAAARRLYSTLREERDAARRRYVAPLRERIERLGRIVFGDTFCVEVDDTLAVTSRTLEGRTIPFDDLSGGAREQIGLLARLSCALAVADDGGVPVVLDDALGNSDPERLGSMGAALAVAGRSCQIVVLTCTPDRYRHVGGATVVRLLGGQVVP